MQWSSGFRVFLATALLLQISLSETIAGNLSFNPPDSLTGQVAANKVGKIFSEDLMAVLQGNSISIQQQDSSGIRKTIAEGITFNVKVSGSKVTGYCYFNQGNRLSDLLGTDAGSTDIIETDSGIQILGQIKSISNGQITVLENGSHRQVPISETASIKAANVFEFTAIAKTKGSMTPDKAFQTESDRIVFTPTCNKDLAEKLLHKQSKPSSSSAWETISDRVVYFAGGMAMIAVVGGIAIPLAIVVPISRYHKKMRNRRNSQMAELMFRNFTARLRQNQPARRQNNNNQNF